MSRPNFHCDIPQGSNCRQSLLTTEFLCTPFLKTCDENISCANCFAALEIFWIALFERQRRIQTSTIKIISRLEVQVNTYVFHWNIGKVAGFLCNCFSSSVYSTIFLIASYLLITLMLSINCSLLPFLLLTISSLLFFAINFFLR